MSHTWDEINNIKADAKNDMLMQAFKYCYQHNVDTVEMQINFSNGKAIMATITFSAPEEDSE